MGLCRACTSRIRALFVGHNSADRDFDEEVHTHLTLLAERFVRQGNDAGGGALRSAPPVWKQRFIEGGPERNVDVLIVGDTVAGSPLRSAAGALQAGSHCGDYVITRTGHRCKYGNFQSDQRGNAQNLTSEKSGTTSTADVDLRREPPSSREQFWLQVPR